MHNDNAVVFPTVDKIASASRLFSTPHATKTELIKCLQDSCILTRLAQAG
jgi:hypothetical protein